MLLGAILIPRIGLEFAFLGIKIVPKSIPAGRRGAKRYKVEIVRESSFFSRFHSLGIDFASLLLLPLDEVKDESGQVIQEDF
jgi:hypothetical protein